MDLDRMAADILQAFTIEPRPLDRMISRYLREHRGIASFERRVLYDVLFGVMRWQTRLRGWLDSEGYRRAKWFDLIRLYITWKKIGYLPNDDLFHNVEKLDDRRAFKSDSVFLSFPDVIYSRLISGYGRKNAYLIADAMNASPGTIIRINPILTDRQNVMKSLRANGIDTSKTKLSPLGIKLASRVDLKSNELYRSGFIDIQDEASQLASIAVGAISGERILDACAGGGGKSLTMAMLADDKADIIASDVDARRLKDLLRRAERSKISSIKTMPYADLFSRSSKSSFDKILIDAPCSGTGTIGRNPDLKWRVDDGIIAKYSKVQLDLLERFAPLVKRGGRIVYVTCSALKDENSDVIDEFLKFHSEFNLVDAYDILASQGVIGADGITGNGTMATYPYLGSWDFIFTAVLELK